MSSQKDIISDIIGKRYGRLVVISYSHNIKNNNKRVGYKHYYNCKCDCGNNCIVERNSIKYGNTQSCGCIHKQQLSDRNKQTARLNGDSSNKYMKLHNSWSAMKNRCLSNKNIHYENYGGRGITICDDWLDWNKFKNWAINNGWKSGLTIDRIDINGNYEPSNCRWVDYGVQANNTRHNKMITYNSKTQSLASWCRELNLNYDRTKARLNNCGMTVEEAFQNGYYDKHGYRTII